MNESSPEDFEKLIFTEKEITKEDVG